MTGERGIERWTSAWPDALAFALGLGAAGIAGWTTTDLVWSLWLSSLAVGYAMIVWTIIRPALEIARAVSRDYALIKQATAQSPAPVVAGGGILLGVGLFMLAFFTVHFGGFHYVHSQFLAAFFPLHGGTTGRAGTANLSTYLEVFSRYWTFLPAAFLAERAGFVRQDKGIVNMKTQMFAPYQNVMRMHGLIFFFAFAHFARLDAFAVYAVVYAVYFFPWWLIRRSGVRSPGALTGRVRNTRIETPR
jgi:hypothetical protein